MKKNNFAPEPKVIYITISYSDPLEKYVGRLRVGNEEYEVYGDTPSETHHRAIEFKKELEAELRKRAYMDNKYQTPEHLNKLYENILIHPKQSLTTKEREYQETIRVLQTKIQDLEKENEVLYKVIEKTGGSVIKYTVVEKKTNE